MEGLSCSPALNGITIFLSEKLISSRKSLHPLPAHARTEAKQCFAGSRPSIKKRPIWVFKIRDGRTVLFAGIKRDYDFSFRKINFFKKKSSPSAGSRSNRGKAMLCRFSSFHKKKTHLGL